MKEFSSAELSRNVAAVTDAATRAPVAITVYRKPKFVLMAMDDYRALAGDRRRVQEIDHFVGLARAGDPSQRTLAYAVLVQAVRSPRAPAPLRAKVAPVLDAAWGDPRSAPSLVQAITLMRVESQYRERLDAYRKQGGR